MIVTLANELPRDNDKQLVKSLIVISNISFLSWIISSTISILNGDDVDPAEMVTLKTSEVDFA